MKLSQPHASIFVPDGTEPDAAIARTTHLGIGAHQDDLEFMALHGILECYQKEDSWFGGITCTNGSGSPRAGAYESNTDEQMMEVRKKEQNAAAELGQYGFMAQLWHTSSTLKDTAGREPIEDIKGLLLASRPETVYTHNPADKHDTHVAVCTATLAALRELPEDARPTRVLGCEVWRDLDWLPDEDKQVLDVSAHRDLAAKLSATFDSQIAGGKRYDLAVVGRRMANATFFASHATDTMEQAWFALDLTPLVNDPALDLATYVQDHITRFQAEVSERLSRYLR